MLDFGTVKPGTLLTIPFHTFSSDDPSASVTITGLATTDIEVYKDGGNTTRASDTGYALLGTDGIDEFGTGIHGISIDLASNAVDDFYEAGSQFFCVIASITVDAATVNFIAATWRIGYPGALLDTIITTRTSATVFIMEEGPPDNDALNGCKVIIHDQASAVQMEIGYVSDYAGSTKTVTLASDPGIFTTVAGDNLSFFPPDNVVAVAGTAQTAGDLAALIVTVDNLLDTEIAAITAAVITNAAGADVAADIIALKAETVLIVADTGELQSDDVPGLIAALNDPTVGAIADAVLDEDMTAHQSQGSLGQAIGDPGADADTLYGSIVTGATGANISADIIAVKAETAVIVDDTSNTLDTKLNTIDDFLDTEIAAIVAAVITNAAGADIAADIIALKAETVSILADTNILQVEWANGGRLDLIIDAILADTVIIGAAGAGLTDLGGMSTAMIAEVKAEVQAVLLTDTVAQPGQETPAAAQTMAKMIAFLYKNWRNHKVESATLFELYNDNTTTVDQKAVVSDDGSDADKGEMATGP